MYKAVVATTMTEMAKVQLLVLFFFHCLDEKVSARMKNCRSFYKAFAATFGAVYSN